jgi:alanine or glycine:cation symporter, AGCS family
MTDFLNDIIGAYNQYVGSYAILALLIPTGLFFTFYLKFLQVSKFKHAIQIVSGKFATKKTKGDVSSFKALTTALSATVGTGNIVGVALAITIGGPGAIFWIWIVGFLGMMLKMVECTLAQKFRRINPDGTVSGGPMYYIEDGLKSVLGKGAKYLAVVFSIATILCSFGTGNMAQGNSMTAALQNTYNLSEPISSLLNKSIYISNWISSIGVSSNDISKWFYAFVITSLVLLIIVGGLKRIAEVTSKLVPFMAVSYFIAAIVVLIVFYQAIPGALILIISDAFTGSAATGGFLGSTFIIALRYGVQRGLFSNEAGQGSAPIAHAAAKTDEPLQEGLVASLEPLVDTIIICTLTALVIVVTGAWTSVDAEGVGVTILGFESGLGEIGLGGIAKHIVSIGLLLFAFSTVISWSYYGNRAVQYVFGDKAIMPFYFVYGFFVFLGCVWGLEIVWNFVDMVITFMTIPNLIALILLAPVMKKEVKNYFKTKTKSI